MKLLQEVLRLCTAGRRGVSVRGTAGPGELRVTVPASLPGAATMGVAVRYCAGNCGCPRHAVTVGTGVISESATAPAPASRSLMRTPLSGAVAACVRHGRTSSACGTVLMLEITL